MAVTSKGKVNMNTQKMNDWMAMASDFIFRSSPFLPAYVC